VKALRPLLLGFALASALAAPRAGVAAPKTAGLADLDPDNDAEVAPPEPIPDCEGRLTAAGIRFRRAELPIRGRPPAPLCGAEQVVIYQGGPRKIRYNGAPLVTCGMALALAGFEEILSEEAEQRFGKRVVSLMHGGTYSCRRMARFRLVSEHSYANAIDIRSLRLENGREISVLRHFGKQKPEGEFLRAVAQRLYDEGVFSVVLTERFDALHRDHFHLDLARYRVDGTR
jgi:hypothetical protein